MPKFSYPRVLFEAILTFSPLILAFGALILFSFLSGCAQISNTYYVQGDNNRLTATDSVNKSTKDLLDMAGSAYGEAATNQGAKQ
jgi:hypothetical protein